jgi:hypothetical protein
LLAGCSAGPTTPQKIEVTYAGTSGGEQSTQTVEIAKVDCRISGSISSMTLPAEDFAVPDQELPDFTATIFGTDPATSTYIFTVRLDDGVYYTSTAPFELTEAQGLTVDHLPGTVSAFENGQAVEKLDSKAALTATLVCQ